MAHFAPFSLSRSKMLLPLTILSERVRTWNDTMVNRVVPMQHAIILCNPPRSSCKSSQGSRTSSMHAVGALLCMLLRSRWGCAYVEPATEKLWGSFVCKTVDWRPRTLVDWARLGPFPSSLFSSRFPREEGEKTISMRL